jgi:putative membrane protein insertion efficiency factor
MLKKIALLFIKLYQILISPFLGNNCRFHPSCSNYAYEAITKFGLKGILLVTRRLLRCHPLGGSGIDCVPEKLNYFNQKRRIYEQRN